MSKHYVVVLAPQRGGGWRAHFPDFPGCRAEGVLVNEAIESAAHEVRRQIDQIRSSKKTIPSPRSYEEVRANDLWAQERGIDWATAVISLVNIAAVD